MIPQKYKKLYLEAKKVRECAYAPYSHYLVGAALLTKTGKVFTGCNVENASLGGTVCAERVAIFKAVSENERDFKTIVIVSK
ncbi:MAG: cytidine deaminase, partial [Deltaproteobacteria bacterium]|nr:cytidine deaminase [Deltaproteobacteria bacterium]